MAGNCTGGRRRRRSGSQRMSESISHEQYRELVRSGQAKGSKYRNKPVEIDGIRFVSKMEGRRYVQLRDMQRAGIIRNLQLHTQYKLVVNGVLICRYRPDFEYDEAATGDHIVEDVKGYRNHIYAMKAQLMKACHGITVREATA